MAATNSYLEIIMYAEDKNGLVGTSVRNVYPRLVELCVDSEPQGLEVYVDEYPIKTPMMITSWVNHDIRLRVVSTQEGYNFSSWSDAVVTDDRKIRLQPNSNPGLLATFCIDGNETCVTEAEARASASLIEARCPTQAPSAAPTMIATTKAPSSNKTAIEEVEENWPVDGEDDVYITADGEPIPERPHDENLPPPDEVWDMFDDEDAATVTVGLPSLAIVTVSLALFVVEILL